ncbi:cytochrome c oxidase copper chaperone-like protein [Chytriomyces sp. MP71]|nr:cytochrome c oxidase copper chaperone-like protein [Chytriomyces sp. MP71]
MSNLLQRGSPSTEATPVAPTVSPEPATVPTCKPCCACPDTRAVRDECVITYGEESAKCQELIAAHQDCMRKMGFNI